MANSAAELTHDLKSLAVRGIVRVAKIIFSQNSTGHFLADMRQ
jgi:hypothetical protein